MLLSEIKNLTIYPVYHGYSGEVVDVRELKLPVHFAYEKKLSERYALKSKKVGTFKLSFSNPLVISTEQEFQAAWKAAGLEEPEDFSSMEELHKFEDHFKDKHDGIIFKQGLCQSSELLENTFGDDEVIVFDSKVITQL